jgi:hypothetical protein
MNVSISPKFVCMPSSFVAYANGNKRRACSDGHEGCRWPGWSGGAGDDWGWSGRVVQGCLGLPPYVWKPRDSNSYIYIYGRGNGSPGLPLLMEAPSRTRSTQHPHACDSHAVNSQESRTISVRQYTNAYIYIYIY